MMAGEALTERQRETLSSWNFVSHSTTQVRYYTQMIEIVERTIRASHVYGIDPADYVHILEAILEDDPVLNKYIESRQWIGEDTRPLFITLFARLLVSQIVQGRIRTG